MLAEAANDGRSLGEAFLLILLGVVIGGALNVVVARVTLRLRRRAITKALLADVKFCCAKAEGIGGYLQELVIPQWEAGHYSASYPTAISTSFWEACLRDIDQLPQTNLKRLLAFYQFAQHINMGLGVMQSEQKLSEQLALGGRFQEPEGRDIAKAFRVSVLQKAHLTAGMCRRFASYKNIGKLGELPDDMFALPPM